MINPLTAQLLPPVAKTDKSTRTTPATGERDQAVSAPRASGPAGLAASITADGGLGFLQSRLEEKMNSLFEKATADNPELAAAGPAAFFDTSIDVTPEATADRIVGFALGMRGTFSRQNPDLDEGEMMSRFEAEIRRGISEGFGHARGVLGDLELNEGQIKDNVDGTWDLVQQKLADFFSPGEDGGAE